VPGNERIMQKLQKEIRGMKEHERDAGYDDKTRRRNWGLQRHTANNIFDLCISNKDLAKPQS
jgi:hypothetical protein